MVQESEVSPIDHRVGQVAPDHDKKLVIDYVVFFALSQVFIH
jgi:hypothetical protein